LPSTSPLLASREPHSVEAERTVLGALLLDPECVVHVLPTVAPHDFFDPTHRKIFEAISRLYEDRKPIDFVTVAEALRGDEAVQAIGGSAFLAALASDVPTSAHAGQYAAIVRDKAMHRQLLDAGSIITDLGRNEKLSAEEALERAEQKLLAISRHVGREHKPEHIGDIGTASYERYTRLHDAEDKAALFGLTTGFRELDHMLTGLAPGSFMIVAARPSMGKTSFALDVARHAAAKQGKNVAVLSLEMSKEELMDRTIAGYLGVNAWRLKKGELSQNDFDRMGVLFDELKKHPLYIDDDPDTTISNIRSKARRQQMEHGLDLLVVDYLQLIETTDRASGENRTQEVSHISRSLKNLARELAVPIIAVAQLSRSPEQRNPPIPILSDLRDSGSIEQDADIVLMLYRQSYYNEDCDKPNETDVYVRKNRNGPTGRVSLHFDMEKMSFRDVRKVVA
jgi:replicative DNA helicase